MLQSPFTCHLSEGCGAAGEISILSRRPRRPELVLPQRGSLVCRLRAAALARVDQRPASVAFTKERDSSSCS